MFLNTAHWMVSMSERKRNTMSERKLYPGWLLEGFPTLRWMWLGVTPQWINFFAQTAAGFESQCMPDLQQYVYTYFERKKLHGGVSESIHPEIWKQQLGEENTYKKIGRVILDEDSNTMNFQITLFLLPWENTLALMMIEMGWATWL